MGLNPTATNFHEVHGIAKMKFPLNWKYHPFLNHAYWFIFTTSNFYSCEDILHDVKHQSQIILQHPIHWMKFISMLFFDGLHTTPSTNLYSIPPPTMVKTNVWPDIENQPEYCPSFKYMYPITYVLILFTWNTQYITYPTRYNDLWYPWIPNWQGIYIKLRKRNTLPKPICGTLENNLGCFFSSNFFI